jgi:hypothetical protein
MTTPTPNALVEALEKADRELTGTLLAKMENTDAAAATVRLKRAAQDLCCSLRAAAETPEEQSPAARLGALLNEPGARAVRKYFALKSREPAPEPDATPPDPMGDDLRASIVRELIAFWDAHPHRTSVPAEVRRQMAQEAGAFARNALGEVEELRQLAARSAGAKPEPDATPDEGTALDPWGLLLEARRRLDQDACASCGAQPGTGERRCVECRTLRYLREIPLEPAELAALRQAEGPANRSNRDGD